MFNASSGGQPSEEVTSRVDASAESIVRADPGTRFRAERHLKSDDEVARQRREHSEQR